MVFENSNLREKVGWDLWLPELRSLLTDFREMNKKKRKDIEGEYQRLLEEHKIDKEWVDFHKVIKKRFGGFLTKLEHARLPNETISLPNVKPLAAAYGIHALMFDSLLAEPVRGNFLLHHSKTKDDFVRFDRLGSETIYGKGVRYYIPHRKLYGSYHITIVYLEIETNGSTIRHYHYGDEFLYVEDGEIELLLENTGLRAKVKAGEFVHYEGGQSHRVCNNGNRAAKIFLIRFLQLRSGTRSQLFHELSAAKPSESIKTRVIKDMNASAWTNNTRQEFDESKNEPTEVFDRCGLGHFLQLLSSGPYASRLTLNRLVERANKLQIEGYNRSKFARLHHGAIQVKREELQDLAKIYDTSSMLFYDFLFPAFRYAVVVGEEDMIKESSAFGIPEGIVFRVPSRHLAYSDITIALVDFITEKTTVGNCHPGYELLKPLEGEIAVKFGGTLVFSLRKGEYGYFDSSIYHQVSKVGDKPAKVLAIRFLQ